MPVVELDRIELDFSIGTIGWSHAEIDVMLDPPEKSDGDGPRDPADNDIPRLPASPVSLFGVPDAGRCAAMMRSG